MLEGFADEGDDEIIALVPASAAEKAPQGLSVYTVPPPSTALAGLAFEFHGAARLAARDRAPQISKGDLSRTVRHDFFRRHEHDVRPASSEQVRLCKSPGDGAEGEALLACCFEVTDLFAC